MMSAGASMLAMEGGAGDASYAKNSRVQAEACRFVQPVLEQAILQMQLPGQRLLKIADLGCSSGPNTVSHMTLIVQTLKSRYAAAAAPPVPEFLVFFVDLLSNDFNSLFRTLSQVQQEETARKTLAATEEYYSTGVAGSFYGRLLPRESLDVVFSSFSLHWLSKIPDEVQRPDSPAYNDGFVWIHGGKSSVGRAYAQQAKNDMCAFLRARAEEMVSGGLMLLLLRGRNDADPTSQYDASGTTMFGIHMEEIFKELISLGYLDKKLRDSFNVPIYYRTLDEMKEAIDEVDEFTVKRLELLNDIPGNASTPAELKASPTDCGRRVAKMCRCLLGVLIESHMGVDVANRFFQRLEERAIERSQAEALERRVVRILINVAVLVRK